MKPTTSTDDRVAIYGDRLDFVLKSFVRTAWASTAAERTWSSRFSRVRAAVARTEWMSVVRRLRPCALFQLRGQDIEIFSGFWGTENLSWRRLSESTPRVGAWWLDACIPRNVASWAVVLGSDSDIATFERAWNAGNHTAMGELLGYPSCCQRFFFEVVEAQRCVDTVWAMSHQEPHIDGRRFGRSVDGSPVSNILLQSVGVRAIPHAPCSYGCRGTAQLAGDLFDVATKTGSEEEYAWLSSILSWPAEWSALHGIAEIKTPILKLCTPTDATAGEYVVRWNGSVMPEEGAKGIGFPYKVSGKPPAAARLTWPVSSK